MLAKGQAVLHIEIRLFCLKFIGKKRFLKEFLAQPKRQRHSERGKTARTVCQISFEQTLKFYKRLVIEYHEVDIPKPNASSFQAVINRKAWIAGIELFAGEALLLRGRNDAAVLDECRSAVMVEGGKA